MQVRKLLNDDNAVSPVIGVILMVAITVILAAVIASFVLGLGGSTQETPTAKFTWNYDSSVGSGSDDGVVKITHDGGDTIKAKELAIRGSGFSNLGLSNPTDGDSGIDLFKNNQQGKTWADVAGDNATADKGGASAVQAGNSITVGASNDYSLRVVWESQEGDSSSTLAEHKGPNTS